MKIFVIIFFGVIATSLAFYDESYYGTLSSEIQERITGGTEMTENLFSKFNYQVGLYVIINGNKGICGGVLIDPKVVLTAAHCVDGASRVGVFMGTIVRPDNIDSYGVTQCDLRNVKVHESWNRSTGNNDIALIILPNAVQQSKYIGVIEIAPRNFDCTTGQGWISGWGKQSDNIFQFLYDPYSSELYYLKVNAKRCYGSSTICSTAGGTDGACEGDSGGPFAFENNSGGRYLCAVNSASLSDECRNDKQRIHTSAQYYCSNGWICKNSGQLVGCNY